MSSHHGISDGNTVSSWSEMVKSIELSKKKLPWNPNETIPVERVSLYEVKYLNSLSEYVYIHPEKTSRKNF